MRMNLNLTYEHGYDRFMLARNPDLFGNTGTVRRYRRQINRAWAKRHRRDYGVNSIPAYRIYIKAYGFLVGDGDGDAMGYTGDSDEAISSWV